ncbi:MAG: Rpn family recombination-promoting nuclease/putative transposase [Magnetococcales bacterium]|nr:Rpn family recombination-promoting nuclease/putative transposase [Magnetococcales bacterium]
MNRILEQWAKENPDWEQLPPVIPVVVYHGATAWKVPNEFHALLAGGAVLRPFLPNFRFIVVDLGQIDDDMISNDPRLRVGLLALKYVFREKEQTGILETIGISLRDVPEMLYQVVLYIVQTYKSVNEMEIRNLIHTAQPKEEAEMMSKFARDVLAGKPDWVLNMVREDELQKARLESKASSLLKLMRHRFGQIPGWVSTKINSADTELIETWMIRILDAQSVEDVFAA